MYGSIVGKGYGRVASEDTYKKIGFDQFLQDVNGSAIKVELVLAYVRYLAEVSTIDQTFKCALGLDMRWKATDKDVKSWETDSASFVPEYVPNFEFPNSKDFTEERRLWANGNAFKIVQVKGVSYCFVRTLVIGVFMTNLDLHGFPFDSISLKIVIDMSFESVKEAIFCPAEEALNPETGELGSGGIVCLNREFSALAEFEIERCLIEFASRSTKDAVGDENAFRWSQVTLKFQICRRWEGYIGRLAFLAFLLSLTSVCSFGFDVIDDLGDRSGFLVNLILANVAFQFIVSDQLPAVPYLTILDKYCLSMFALTVVLLVVSTLIGHMQLSESEIRYYDERIFMPLVCAAVFVINTGFILLGYRWRQWEHRKLGYGQLTLSKLSKNKANHSAALVNGLSLLPESKIPHETFVNPFVTFAAT